MGRPVPGTNLLFQIIGDFSYNATSGAVKPVGGITYLVTAPTNIQQVALDPLRAAAYLGIIVAFCAVFSLIWLEVGGLGPAKVAKQLMDSGMQIPGYRRSGRPIEAVLKRYIPVVTVSRRNHCRACGWHVRFPWRVRYRHRNLAVSGYNLPVL